MELGDSLAKSTQGKMETRIPGQQNTFKENDWTHYTRQDSNLRPSV